MWNIFNESGKLAGVATSLDDVNSKVILAIIREHNDNPEVIKELRSYYLDSRELNDKIPPIEIKYENNCKVKRLGSLNLFVVFDHNGKQLGIRKSFDAAECILLELDLDCFQKERSYKYGYKAVWQDDCDDDSQFVLKA